jgi:cysteinyl-tRNA synthetase
MKNAALALLALLCLSCDNSDPDEGNARDYRQDMRDFVIGISQKAKTGSTPFYVIPQNGIELVTVGEDNPAPHTAYLNAIDGNGQEDLLYGYDNDNDATPFETTAYLKNLLNIPKAAGKTILVTDYCSTPSKMTGSYQANAASGYVSYAAQERDLNVIPQGQPNNVNNAVVTTLSQAKNFLYLINSENYSTKQAFINAVKATDYDLVIIDLFVNEEMLTAADVAQLSSKANGGKRLVICYMSIGEAEDYRYYWDNAWSSSKPQWISAENPDWPGNYKVKYWDEEWQGIIYKNSDSYLSKITAAGFDGVYLDIIDAFEYFEE